jgi:hypothetical protein
VAGGGGEGARGRGRGGEREKERERERAGERRPAPGTATGTESERGSERCHADGGCPQDGRGNAAPSFSAAAKHIKVSAHATQKQRDLIPLRAQTIYVRARTPLCAFLAHANAHANAHAIYTDLYRFMRRASVEMFARVRVGERRLIRTPRTCSGWADGVRERARVHTRARALAPTVVRMRA